MLISQSIPRPTARSMLTAAGMIQFVPSSLGAGLVDGSGVSVGGIGVVVALGPGVAVGVSFSLSPYPFMNNRICSEKKFFTEEKISLI